MNLNTGFYEKGKLISNRKKIIKNYVIKGSFAMDLLTFLAILFTPNKISLIYLYKIVKIQEMITNLERFLFAEDLLYTTISMIKLILNIIFISHIFACLWCFIGKNNTSSKNN